MTANTNRYSSYTAASSGSGSKDGDKAEKRDLWTSMLHSVASGKRLPEKNIILLGGTVDSQREFFESLSNNELRRSLDRNASRIPPVANSFALGYTYYDVLDADQEDTLARISLYTLTSPSSAFASLLQPLLTPPVDTKHPDSHLAGLVPALEMDAPVARVDPAAQDSAGLAVE